MGRAKLKMELIPKEKMRYTTYQKRKQGIIKKATELSRLCDVNTAMIIYPANSDHPEIWPENPDEIKNTIASYKAKKTDNGKRSYDLNDFFEDRKKKIEDELQKARKRNMEAKYATWFEELDGLSEAELRQFAMELENKENLVRRIEFQKRSMQPVFHYNNQSLDHVQQVMSHHGIGHLMNHHDHHLGWFNDPVPLSSSYVPLKREYGYPGFEGGVVYDNMNNPYLNSWQFQPAPVVPCGLTPEFAIQELASQVNLGEYDGTGEFVVDDHHGRFLGN